MSNVSIIDVWVTHVRTCFVFCSFLSASLNSRQSWRLSVQCRRSKYIRLYVFPISTATRTITRITTVGFSYDNNNSNSNSTQNSQSLRVYEFGKFEENYDWIQCQFKSYPNHVYYNTRTGCNTWYRLVSHFMDIPFASVRRVSWFEFKKGNIKLRSYLFYNFLHFSRFWGQ